MHKQVDSIARRFSVGIREWRNWDFNESEGVLHHQSFFLELHAHVSEFMYISPQLPAIEVNYGVVGLHKELFKLCQITNPKLPNYKWIESREDLGY